jgi:hypothetical protein
MICFWEVRPRKSATVWDVNQRKQGKALIQMRAEAEMMD